MAEWANRLRKSIVDLSPDGEAFETNSGDLKEALCMSIIEMSDVEIGNFCQFLLVAGDKKQS